MTEETCRRLMVGCFFGRAPGSGLLALLIGLAIEMIQNIAIFCVFQICDKKYVYMYIYLLSFPNKSYLSCLHTSQ